MTQAGRTKVQKAFDYVDEAMRRACMEVLDSGDYYLGQQNDRFEKAFADYVGTEHAVAVNSGSSAMLLILRALGVGGDDEVIVPAMGFVTLAEAVAVAGARARFADVEPETYNLDPARLSDALTPATRAIVPAHKYGHPANLDQILAFAREHELVVIEDCCHALGARYRGRAVGSFGEAGFYSFAGKGISVCGLGGMAATNNGALAEELRLLRDHGRPRAKGKRFYEITRVGYNLRLSELHAAIGRSQLEHVESWNERRRRNAERYNRAFLEATLPLVVPVVLPDSEHAFLHYTVRVDASLRTRLREFLATQGIETAVLYPIELHLLAPYRELWGHEPGEYPVTEQLTQEIVTLPNHPGMDEDQISHVITSVTDFFAASPEGG